MFFLRKKIFDSSSHPFGLDISDLSLKIALTERDAKQDFVRSFGSVSFPRGIVVDGEIIKPDEVSKAILECLNGHIQPEKIRGRDVVCSVPEMKAFLRLISVPQMSEGELPEAIRWELEGNIPMPLDQIYYDFQVLDEKLGLLTEKKKMSVLVVAVARHVVDQYVDVIERAGLRIVGMETESLAQARVLIASHEDPPKTSLIVDIGDRRTSFLIAVGNVPIFTSSSSLSSQMITDAIAKALRIAEDEAEKMKVQHGIGMGNIAQVLLNAARPVLEDFVVEIERSMDFYVNSLRYTENVDRIFLCGGGSNLQGLVPYMVRRLQKPVELGNPWVNFFLGDGLPPIPYDDALRYSTALGLSLREMTFKDDD